MKRNLLILALLFSLPSSAEETGTSYGDLFIEEERGNVGTVRLGFDFGYSFSNPYSDVWTFSGTAEYQFARHVRMGLLGRGFAASKASITEKVEEAVKSEGITQTIRNPSNSAYFLVTLIPFIGHLNFFSIDTFPFEIFARAGVGAVKYSGESTSFGTLLYGFGIESQIIKNMAFQFVLDQEIEAIARDNAQSRTTGQLGLSVRI